MVEVNLLGAMTATEVFLDQLREGGGDLVNISSVAGRTARAGNAVYAATKWGINGWSEALRQELQPDIRVMVIEPGAVATELTDHITDPETKQAAQQMSRSSPSRRGHRRGHRVRRHPPAPDDPQRDPRAAHSTALIHSTRVDPASIRPRPRGVFIAPGVEPGPAPQNPVICASPPCLANLSSRTPIRRSTRAVLLGDLCMSHSVTAPAVPASAGIWLACEGLTT